MAGIVLFILAGAVLPLPQHQRYRSEVSVIPDGGREESFTIRWPQDRVQPVDASPAASLKTAGAATVLLAGADGVGAASEVFRLRDADDNVVGLASRTTSRRSAGGGPPVQGTDWILLLPSRGALFMTQLNGIDAAPRPGGHGSDLVPAADAPGFWSAGNRLRITAGPAQGGAGEVVGGSDEFAGLEGTYEETWELEDAAPNGPTRGHITLVTRVEAAR